MNIRRLSVALTAPLLILTIVGGTATAPRSAAHAVQDAKPTIHVGYFPNITHAQALLGFSEHAFTRYLPNVNVTATTFNAGPDEMNALFAGAIDIGYIGAGPAINGFVRSHGAVVIVAGAASGGSVLVARAGTNIKSVKDLAGKTVSVPQMGNTQDILLRQLLNENGLKPADHGGSVKVVAVQNADTLALFQKGDLDAALVPEPYGTRLIASVGAGIVLDWKQIYGGNVPVTVVVASAAFAKAHPDLLVRFLRVHRQLTNQLQATHYHKDSLGIEALLNAQIKTLTGKPLTSQILEKSLTKVTFSTSLDQAALSQFAGFSATAGYLKRGVNLAGLVDTWPLAHLNDQSIH
ncbi:MAG: TauA [Chloroflexi bacterium]|nr:TauA [Chloroflexota bacterium]